MRTAAASAERPLFAIAMMCAAMLCFASMGAAVKLLSLEYPLLQIVWARYFFHLLMVLLLARGRVREVTRTARLGMQLLRSVLVLGATVLSFAGLARLPLATFVSLGFLGPLLVVAFAALLLRERVTAGRWLAVVIGLVGVLVIARPGSGALGPAMLLPLAMAVCYALYQLLTRVIRGSAPPLNSLFYTALVGACASSLLVPLHWVWPDTLGWCLMVAAAGFGGLGHFAVIRAYESGAASVVAPFHYSELLWSTLLGLALFSELPDSWTLAGGSLLVASGIYVVTGERRRASG